MPKKTSIEIENKIIELSKNNLTMANVAKEVGVTHKVIKRIAKEHNLTFAKGSNAKTEQKVINKIIKLHEEGYTVNYISEKIKVSVATINRILNNNGYINRCRKLNITKEVEEEICSLYKKGFSTVDIAKIFNNTIKSDHTISKILKQNNIEVRTSGNKSIIEQPRFFQNIDTEEKAYFLGLITADGNVHIDKRGQMVFQIMLQSKDRYILENLRDCLGSKIKEKDFNNKKVKIIPRKLSYDYKKDEYSFRLNSKIICNDLINLGVVPNKTFNTYIPDCIPNNLLHHYIRGYFDGDGCVTFTKNVLKIIFYGQHNYLESLKKIFSHELNTNDNKIFDKDTVSMLTYGSKKDVKALYEYMYKDANYFLIRKKDKFISHINTEVSN